VVPEALLVQQVIPVFQLTCQFDLRPAAHMVVVLGQDIILETPRLDPMVQVVQAQSESYGLVIDLVT
jgi:hypothetical protein